MKGQKGKGRKKQKPRIGTSSNARFKYPNFCKNAG